MTAPFDLLPTKSAVISPCGKYRYHLRRETGSGHGVATFVMLNPSTADAEVDDPTVRKCLGFALRWGCCELHVVNLFAIRATAPADLQTAGDPVGSENREWVEHAIKKVRRNLIVGPVVCAWGIHGSYMDQDQTVLGWIEGLCQPMCLGMTKDGHPRHPLYMPYSAELVAFGGRKKGVRNQKP
jgi:hypothetical protein